MNAAAWAAIGTAVLGLLTYMGVRFSGRSAVKAAEVTSKAVEVTVQAQAYGDALKIWIETVDDLRGQVTGFRSRLTEMEKSLDTTRNELVDTQTKLREADSREVSLERRVQQLEDFIAGQGLVVPPARKGS